MRPVDTNSYESETEGLFQPGGNIQIAAVASIAISMKRIADVLQTALEEKDASR